MTPKEREQLTNEYPMIDVPRLIKALLACAVVAFIASVVV